LTRRFGAEAPAHRFVGQEQGSTRSRDYSELTSSLVTRIASA
jgi:hypothetical protein